MTTEAVPGAVKTTDNLRISFVPDGSNALSVAILNGGTAKLLTYSLTPSGWAFPITEAEVVDARLTLGVTGSAPGSAKYGPITLQYVYGDAGDVAKAALTPGVKGKLVYRDVLPNATDYAVGQKADVITIIAGRQRKDPAAADGLFTTTQTIYVVAGGFASDQTLVA